MALKHAFFPRGAAIESVKLRDSLFAVARPTYSGDVFRAWKQGGERDGQFFVLCAHNLEARTRQNRLIGVPQPQSCNQDPLTLP